MTEAATAETEVQIDERTQTLLSILDHAVFEYDTVKAEFLTWLDTKGPLTTIEWGVMPLTLAAAKAKVYGDFAKDIRFDLSTDFSTGHMEILESMRLSLTASVLQGASKTGRSTNPMAAEIERATLRYQAELLETVTRQIGREQRKAAR